MAQHSKNRPEEIKADLLIIGGGGAGLASAVAAAEEGIRRIIVLEKRGAVKGNTALSTGLFAADSPAQKRREIVFRRDELFKIAMEWAHWKTNPRIVRTFINKSGDTIKWLEDKGLHFNCIPMYPNQDILTWHMTKGYGARMMKLLRSKCQELGVEIMVRTPAKKILTGAGGEITGVQAEKKGEVITFSSGSIILATGGYGGNKELLKKYSAEYRENMQCVGLPHNGDGLLMAMEIGAATEGLGLLLMSGPQIPGGASLKLGNPPESFRVPLMAIALEPNTLWVNKLGERFIDEAVGYHHFVSSNAVNRQPDNLCFTLLDSALVQIMTYDGIRIGMGPKNVEKRNRMPGLARELNALDKTKWLKMADSWEDIADWIGADKVVLENTIEEYNKSCGQGYDSLFAKDRTFLVPLLTPPYYAIRSNSDILDTLGGIKINHNMEVLDKNNNSIPGLYAAGVVAGGWQADTYNDTLSGAASGFAINSGRIAAENAARYLMH